MLKAIETVYNGYKFRSRLEARWAVFFDALKIEYQYEPEGFDLGKTTDYEEIFEHFSFSAAGYYLPDFYLPGFNTYIEIKGETPTQEETDKAILLSAVTGKKVYIFFGAIEKQLTNESSSNCTMGWDNYHQWCECATCGKLGIEFSGYADRLDCTCSPFSGGRYNGAESPRLRMAYKLAQQARFEHGETPLVRN